MAKAVTLVSTTVEGQFAELAGKVQLLESLNTAGDQPNNISVVPDAEAGNIAITFTANATFGVDSTTGALTFTVNEYLADAPAP